MYPDPTLSCAVRELTERVAEEEDAEWLLLNATRGTQSRLRVTGLSPPIRQHGTSRYKAARDSLLFAYQRRWPAEYTTPEQPIIQFKISSLVGQLTDSVLPHG
jgi:hypothetical protein